MTYLVPHEQPYRGDGYIDTLDDVERWWEANRHKAWNPQLGVYTSGEPTAEELKQIETEESINLEQIILDKFEVAIETCFSREVVSARVTSNLDDNTRAVVPSNAILNTSS